MEKKSVYFLKKNAGTERMNCVVPDVLPDCIGRPPRAGNPVELLLAEEACRMWDAHQEERGKFFLQKCSRPGIRRTCSRLAAMRRCEVLNPV